MNGTADGTVKPCEMFSRDNTDRGIRRIPSHTEHKRINLMSFSLMIIYQLLCSPTYVHLCKCLIWCEIKKH